MQIELLEAWKNASVDDKKKFLHCMRRPLQDYLDKKVPLEYALEAMAYGKI